MKSDDFIKRIILKSTLSFLGVYDLTVLRDGRQPNGEECLKVGTDSEASIHLSDYLSYDEMQISALIGVSKPTYFINSAIKQLNIPGTFQEKGIGVVLVSARMMKEDKKEYQHRIISSTHSTTEKGYGKKAVEKFSK
ncbi:hypothetical protein B4U80_03668 [Leptotrombidium deliense]|uniref:Uncharacterized protein n=1 Tax=Leptotrombidium deliense TaxID=299467 RepID=A0A443RWL7_9ACAR|nr:hypothetical protein B4U80_03668 [Leptotrombidium deliense]